MEESSNLSCDVSLSPSFNGVGSVSLEQMERVVSYLWKHRSSYPFREPVDPVKQNIPDYFDIIKNPMDLGTIKNNLANKRYTSSEQVISDCRLMFQNCYLYNAEGFIIRDMCHELESAFESKLKIVQTGVPKVATMSNKPASGVKRSKTSVDISKKKKPSKQSNGREGKELAFGSSRPSTCPKSEGGKESSHFTRECSRPIKRPNKEWPEEEKKLPQGLSFCCDIVKDLLGRKHSEYAWPFYTPVDPESLGIPDYHNIVQFPMDLGTIKSKIEAGQYVNGAEIVSDVRLIFSDCYRYNPPESSVYQMGLKLQEQFERMLSAAPKEIFHELLLAHSSICSDIGKARRNVISNSEDDNQLNAVMLHEQLKSLREEIAKLQKPRDDPPFSNKGSFRDAQMSSRRFGNDNEYQKVQTQTNSDDKDDAIDDFEPMTYDEKRQLSVDLSALSVGKLSHVVNIIQQREPEHRKILGSKEEVEIDVEHLHTKTLRHLQKYVQMCNRKKQPAVNRKRFAQKDHAKKKQELEHRLKEMDCQLKGELLPGVDNESNSHKADSTNTGGDLQTDIVSRLSESDSNSNSDDDSSESEEVSKPAAPPFFTSKIQSLSSLQPRTLPNNIPVVSSKLSSNILPQSTVQTPMPVTNSFVLHPRQNVVGASFGTVEDSSLPARLSGTTKPGEQDTISPKVPIAGNDLGVKNSLGNVPVNGTSLTKPINTLKIEQTIAQKKIEDRKKRLEAAGQIDMNAQSDLLSSFEGNT